LSFGIAEVTVIGKNGDVRFHYKMEDPKYIDLTRLTPIKPGSIAENMQHIVCDKELRLPLLTKADLLSMNFTYLISTPNADGEIYYGSNKASPGKGAKLLITRLRDDQSLNGLAVNGSRVVSKLNNYRTIVSSLDVDCPAARINLVKTEYYDKNGDLRAMFDDRSTYDVAQGSTFDQLRRAICGNAKS
jgi:hypothetical protein